MIVLEFERQPLRLLMFDHRIWCAIEDLSSVLGEPQAALLGYLESDERTEIPCENGGTNLWANELGIYNLIHTLSNPVAKRLKQWLREAAMPSVRQSFAPTKDISQQEALAIAIPIFNNLGVDSERLGMWLLAQYRRIYPAHAEIFVDIRTTDRPKSLVSLPKTPSEDNDSTAIARLSPTQLGRLIAQNYGLGYTPSPQQINRIFTDLNWQVLVQRGKGREWQLTKAGQQFGRLEDCLDRQSKTRLQIRWSPTVAPIVAQKLGII
jgi:hypothetical protein